MIKIIENASTGSAYRLYYFSILVSIGIYFGEITLRYLLSTGIICSIYDVKIVWNEHEVKLETSLRAAVYKDTDVPQIREYTSITKNREFKLII